MNWWLFAYFVLCVILAYASAPGLDLVETSDTPFIFLVVGALALLLFLTGCGGSDEPEGPVCAQTPPGCAVMGGEPVKGVE